MKMSYPKFAIAVLAVGGMNLAGTASAGYSRKQEELRAIRRLRPTEYTFFSKTGYGSPQEGHRHVYVFRQPVERVRSMLNRLGKPAYGSFGLVGYELRSGGFGIFSVGPDPKKGGTCFFNLECSPASGTPRMTKKRHVR